MDDALASFCRNLDNPRLESLDVRGEEDLRLRDGRISFFCLEAGRISSRSTGTPRETRNRRRVRDRIQSGGAKGGGATSCDHNEADRGVMKTDPSFGSGGNCGSPTPSSGNRLAMNGSVSDKISSEVKPSKSGIDYTPLVFRAWGR